MREQEIKVPEDWKLSPELYRAIIKRRYRGWCRWVEGECTEECEWWDDRQGKCAKKDDDEI